MFGTEWSKVFFGGSRWFERWEMPTVVVETHGGTTLCKVSAINDSSKGGGVAKMVAPS